MDREPFGLLELGSNSLKLHIIRPAGGPGPSVRTHKFPWGVAHEFFLRDLLPETSVGELIGCIRAAGERSEGIPVGSMLAVATGVFREIPDLPAIAARVKAETGIRIRVISGEDEARLMARNFPAGAGTGPVVLCDLGGSTTEWAWIRRGRAAGFGSLALGAIRNEIRFRDLRGDPAECRRRSAAWCDGRLAALPVEDGAEIHATGGTARAAGACLGTARIPRASLEGLLDRVVREGPPASLKPERRKVLLAGLVILDRLMARCRSEALEVVDASVGEGMAVALIRLLASHRRSDLHATLLLEVDRREPTSGKD